MRLQVSIPERVWGGLERPVAVSILKDGYVSIPERVWGGLELRERPAPGSGFSRFNP